MTTDLEKAALMRAAALTPAEAQALWQRFSPRHRESVREKMMGDNLLLHQVLNRFKALRIDPWAPTAPAAPELQTSDAETETVEAEDLL